MKVTPAFTPPPACSVVLCTIYYAYFDKYVLS